MESLGNNSYAQNYEGQKFEEFYKIIETRNVRSVFQPIVSLTDCTVIGYEALSRGPRDSYMQNPEVLLDMAKECDKIWELEELFRSKALENILRSKLNAKVFLNINPVIIDNLKFKDSFTKEYLKKYNLDCRNVVFEITERDAIQDLKSFMQTIEYWKNQNYGIAIDDAGSGHSGLNRICKINPHYIKLDMELIRDIDKFPIQQAIVKSMYEFSRLTDCKLIAEGIETEDELKVLIDIGIQYGQGYFIQKPEESINSIKYEVIDTIKRLNIKKNAQYAYNIANVYISSIAKKKEVLDPKILVCDVDSKFKENQDLLGICVVDNGEVKGVVTRNSFYSKLGWRYGYSIYSSKAISIIMNTNYLSVDYKMPIDKVIKLAMARSKDTLYDHVTVTKNSKYYGIVTIKDLIEKTIEIEVDNARHSNPLTGLPGNVIIEQNIEKCIFSKEEYCVLYFDIDNFKPYNDVYGFENGDMIIKFLAKAITDNISKDDFIGHIGGDDFIAIVSSWNAEKVCKRILKNFNELAIEYYDSKDLKNGYIIAQNRHGIEEKFPLVSVSIAGLTNKKREFASSYVLAKESSKLKKKCKQNGGNCYLII
ncbi:GGDEF domain-containing protein [Clostridium sp. BL-8]|uniref:GGDEF domain-containing protein n=1 Tax=Clostridium sp. BL-8 TaxID=349938 RepID=UPI00098C99BC|nr:GGDEF domain-containing protein [Clostridium sp. BL-8]OOM77472.1 cyclic di-GMP phosphodiesterase YfgF [Clostridium sp. BL-8]